ncbi:MAG: hypothetical protein QXU18_06910, partial [Thermoplasmatales archaeon]
DTAVETLSKFKDGIHEREYPKLIKKYFERICELNSCGEPIQNNKLLNSMAQLDFEGDVGPSSFSVLDDGRPLIDLYVVKDDEDEMLLDWYKREILKEMNPINRRRKYFEKKTDFRMRIISVDISYARTLGAQAVCSNSELFYLSRELSKEFYNSETGLKRTEDTYRSF